MRVFLTGASSGIGEALARHYAARGATLGLFARRESELARLAAALAPATGRDVRRRRPRRRRARARGRRLHRQVRRSRRRHRQRGHLARRADRRAGRPADVPRGAWRPTCSGSCTRSRRSSRRCGRRAPARSSASRASRASAAFRARARTRRRRRRRSPISRACASSSWARGVAVVTICPGFIETPLTARNPYAMPFILTADKAARLIARAIARRRRFYVLPWQMAWLGAAAQGRAAVPLRPRSGGPQAQAARCRLTPPATRSSTGPASARARRPVDRASRASSRA